MARQRNRSRTRRRARLAGVATVAGTAAWAAYSYRMMNKPLPSEEEAREYARSFLAQVGLEELCDTWRDERLQIEDRELILYHFESKPGDPALVFVPGTGVYALLYTELMYKLSREGFNVVGFDPRGHGMSSGKRGVYTLGDLVDDAMVVIDHVVSTYGDRVAVSGSSQGGMVAFYCAAAEPRLSAAVCHNVIAPDEPDNERLTRWPGFYGILLRMSKLPPIQAMLKTPMGMLMPPISAYLDLKAEECRLFPDLDRFFKEDPLVVNAVSLSALASLGATPMAVGVEEIETPVMVIHSGGDNIFPEDYVRRVYDRLHCDKEFLYIEDRPHLVTIDYVDEILPPVAAWLKKKMQP
jgi:pimeloyl-ACP methyl ester carboxylesterase